MTATTEFDVGPLTWVKGEIDLAIDRAEAALRQFGEGGDRTQLRFARTHLHQVQGALAIVSLDGLTQFTRAVETLLENGEAGADDDARLQQIGERALAAIRHFLDDLLAGEANQPLRLLPLYQEIRQASGFERTSPTDLFFPDISLRPPKRKTAKAALAEQDLKRLLKQQRARFQRGLLSWLRDAGNLAAVGEMRDALQRIEDTQDIPAARAFWWISGGFLDALATGTLPPEVNVKQLCARIDLQIRRLLEGSRNVAERLMRDALYFVASADGSSPLLDEVRQAYGLQTLMPPATAATATDHPHDALLRRLREGITTAEESWNRFCAGASTALPAFRDQATALHQNAEPLGHTDLRRLLQAIAATGRWLAEKPARHSEALAMELATALILAQNAFEHFSHLGGDFAHQVDVTVARLHSCIAGTPPATGAEIPVLDEMSRRAQEKLLIGQVAREIQSNLAQIEQVLDSFFRDNERRPDPSALDTPARQVIGALTMMGQPAAVEALQTALAEARRFADAGHVAAPGDFERVAERFSEIGFFVDAMQHGNTDFATFSRQLRQEAPAAAEDADDDEDTATVSVEQNLEAARRQTQTLLNDFRQRPDDKAAREALREHLRSLQQEADLIDDPQLGQQVKAALAALEAGEADSARVNEAVATIKPRIAEAPAPSAQTLQLAQASAEELDAELLAIFIEEAHEVQETIAGNLEQIRQQPHDVDSLTTIRRGFHTLKGSGRMVGLRDLGEVAWSLEQVLNLWLRLELEATPALTTLIADAHTLFSSWVSALEAGDTRSPDASALVAAAERLKQSAEPTTEEAAAETAAPMMADAPASTGDSPADTIDIPAPDAGDDDFGADTIILPDPATAEPEPPPVEEEQFDFDLGLDDLLGNDTTLTALDDEALLVADLPGQAELPVADATPPEPTAEHPAEPTAEISLAAAPDDAPEQEDDPAFDFDLNEPEAAPEAEPQTACAAPEPDALLDAVDTEASTTQAPAETEATDTVATSVAAPAATSVATSPALPDAAAAAPFPEAEAVEERPGLAISPTLFQIFLDEATGHLSTLHDGIGTLLHEPEQATPTAMARAAHTLAGIAGTVGLPEINQFGLALEHALLRRDAATRPGSIEALEVVRQAIAALAAMVETVSMQQPPEGNPRLIAELGYLFPPAGSEAYDISKEPFDELAEDGAPETPAAPPAPDAQDTAPLPVEETGSETASAFELPAIQDELDEQLLPIFIEEADELAADIARSLRAWRENPADTAPLHALHRSLHTLKGSARMAGAMTLGEFAHGIESRIEEALRHGNADVDTIDEIESALDSVAQMVDRLRRGEPILPPAAASAPGATAAEPATGATPTGGSVRTTLPAEAATADEGAGHHATLRVRADLIDRLVNDAGELSIARARIEGEMRSLKESMLDLTENVIRLRRQLREVEIQAESQIQSRIAQAEERNSEFDPLEFDRFTRFQELTRMMAESVNDVATVQQNLLRNLDDANAAILSQARMNRELQQELMSVRMVPFASLADRMYRIVRQTAKELGKRANLEIRGGQVEIDRSVLDGISAPIEHMLRNAVAHGLEDRSGRQAAGKAEIGEVTLALAQEGNEIILTMSDDGSGLDFTAIRARGVESGLLGADEAADEARLIELIFAPGFSTAGSISQIAGRGVGMDVVKSEVSALGGRIEVSTEAGRGTTIRLYIPLTLAVTQALLVRTGNHVYAVPSSMIEQVMELREEALVRIQTAGKAEWLGNQYPYRFLAHLLGDAGAMPETHRRYWVLLLRSGAQRIAIQVDELHGNQEVVVKNIGQQLARVVGIAGATVLGDGRVVLILNPVALAARAPLVSGAQPVVQQERQPVERETRAAATLPTVMIVDDSLTVRKITSRLLAREGYQVILAKDGVDALEQMTEIVPDVMLVDIEMPRMDGFDLTRNIRADDRLRHVPIIMITSRTADKHRNYAFEIGVNNYLGKPYQEEELLALVSSYTALRQGITIG